MTVKAPPAVLDAASDRGLGEVIGMYRVAHGVSTQEQRRQSRHAEMLKAALLLAGFSTPALVKWAPVLEAEIIRELLPPLLAKIRAGEQLSFGAVTIGLNGITTPKGMTSWAGLTDLHTRTGYLVVGVGRRQWKHPVAKIPNFPIFWGMVRHLFDSRRGVETD